MLLVRISRKIHLKNSNLKRTLCKDNRGCERDATVARIARAEPEESPADDVPM
ncbi:hypothetical protein NQZ68_022146 [Dissostichus eleginoides]|nr:hypothetical protein NQZ68_022146 [Dissostichus eleginoides]